MTRITAALRKAGWIGSEAGFAWEEREPWGDHRTALTAAPGTEPGSVWPSRFPGGFANQPPVRDSGRRPKTHEFSERATVRDVGEQRASIADPFTRLDTPESSSGNSGRTIDSRAELSGLVTRVFSMPPTGAGARAVLFCAVDSEEQADTIASDAASVVAEQTASPVCVVHVRGLTERFELVRSREAELTTISMDADTACRRLPGLSSEFDYVVLSTSEAAVTAPVLALASAVNGTVLLVSENRTRRKAARTIVDALQTSDVRLLGVVLTDRTYPIPPAIYRRL
jgi:hypothetical protein